MSNTRPRTGPTFIQRSREVAPELKALYHDELGAGRSRVKRPFLQVTEQDVQAVVAMLQRQIDARAPRL